MGNSEYDGDELMRTQPDGAELLKAAQRLLRETVIGQVDPEHKHALLMIINAMSIAERQLRAGNKHELQELSALHELLGQDADSADRDLFQSLLAANRELAKRIREGAADPGSPLRHGVRLHLLATSRQRVMESNPKYLK